MIGVLILAAANSTNAVATAYSPYRACVVRHVRLALPTKPVAERFERATSLCSGQRATASGQISRLPNGPKELLKLDEALEAEILSGKNKNAAN
jgi:hypothetical protein